MFFDNAKAAQALKFIEKLRPVSKCIKRYNFLTICGTSIGVAAIFFQFNGTVYRIRNISYELSQIKFLYLTCHFANIHRSRQDIFDIDIVSSTRSNVGFKLLSDLWVRDFFYDFLISLCSIDQGPLENRALVLAFLKELIFSFATSCAASTSLSRFLFVGATAHQDPKLAK